MLEKLKEIEEKFIGIESELAKPEVVSDKEKFRALMKEHKTLLPIVEKYREYCAEKKNEEEAEEIIAETHDAELKKMAQEERAASKEKCKGFLDELQLLLLPHDPNDDKNVIIEIRGGAGGDEAALFAYNLYRMYTMYAETRGWKYEVLNANETELGGYKEDQHRTGINGGEYVMTGFGHSAVLSVADKVIEGVKNGSISHFFLVGGCDGARPGRNYYTEFVKKTPAESIILTLACGKYRFNDLELGDIDGLPRIMDMGQCNDAYSAIKVAIALAEAFECEVNELPLSMVLSWYEQKAVCILLTLLHLGIKNILLGPTLPAFISHNVLKILVENYAIAPISTPEEDLKKILGN